MSNFGVYQIDFSVAAAGKRVASTKRRIRWRFGFPNETSLSQGLTGTDCRGEEHDVTVVWSITSGKRQVTMDTKEIHYSNNRAGVLDFSWTTKGNHVIKIVCHASPPLSAVPGFRQYDLLVDGQSFFNMPKVYELGLKGSNGYGRSGGGNRQRLAAPTSRSQEEDDLKRAIQASLEESRAHLGENRPTDDRSAYTTPGGGNADLLNFDAPAPPPQPPADSRSVASFYSAPPPSYTPAAYQSAPPFSSTGNIGAPPPANVAPGALVPAVAPPGYYGAPPPQNVPPAPASVPAFAAQPSMPPAPPPQMAPPPPQYASAPPPQYASAPVSAPPPNLMNAPVQSNDVFGLNSAPGDDPFAPKPPGPPTHHDLTNLVMNAYTPQPQTPGSMPVPNGQFSPQQPGAPSPNGIAPVNLTMNTLSQEEEEPQSEMEVALKKLVNVERIDEPAEYGRKLTMMKEEEKKSNANKGKSVPVPPVASGMIGVNATLSQISTVKPEHKAAPQGVMNQPPPGVFAPGAAASGALVVHGQGPPPLQQATGFGLGANLPNGGFSQQQQQQPPYYQQQQPRY